MAILGIVGSPRKNGRTNRLVEAALEGARSRDQATQKVYLVDYDIRQYKGLGGSREALQYCPEELNGLCEEADAIVLGAPVYFGDINGMTKDFMDTVRISNSNGKPALGIAIAGGSGKGLLSGVQTIYHFFFHRQMPHYACLKYFKGDPLDEFIMLARQLIALSTGSEVDEAKEELSRALALITEGNRAQAARHAVRSYQILYFPA